MPMYTREEAAEILGVCVNTLDRMRKERKIGYYQARPRCAVKFSQEHIDKYLKRVEQNPKELFRNSRKRRAWLHQPCSHALCKFRSMSTTCTEI